MGMHLLADDWADVVGSIQHGVAQLHGVTSDTCSSEAKLQAPYAKCNWPDTQTLPDSVDRRYIHKDRKQKGGASIVV